MADERINPIPQNEENPENNDEERFESDTQKLTRKHMEDENHQFTDEEIKNLRVGMSPPVLDEATEVRFEDEDAADRVEDKFIGDKKNDSSDDDTAGKKITPWDTIDPS